MIEFFKHEGNYIINFSDCGQIIITNKDFIIEGNVASVAIQFAKYLYDYSDKYYHTHTEVHRFDNNAHTIDLAFGGIFQSYLAAKIHIFKNKDFKIDLTWIGKPNSQWYEFKETFDRYFSLKSFL